VHVGAGAFFQNPGRTRSDAEVWRQGLEIADMAEPLGFDSVWSAEHHFTDYHMCPNVAQFLTWVAARTQRVLLGSMIMVLPWHDPVRLAEEVSVLDHVSGGRVLFGIGRGLGRIEFDGFRVEMSESRRRFTEYAAAILSALETGKMAYEGELYRQPPIEIRPAPFASFRGRAYASAISPETSRILAELGVGMMIIAQKPWPTIEEDVANYRELYREINGEEAPKPLLATWIAVHESQAAAEEMREQWIMGYCDSVLKHYEFANADLAKIPGYEYYGKLSERIAKHGPDDFSHFLAGLQTTGNPGSVTEQLRENIRRIDGAGVVGIFNYAGMPDDVAFGNFKLFAEKVRPTLQSIDTGVQIGRRPALR
jgi:alkanesulfonate monooxygenase SsuD/methylene tetrahydromethanopterin reductase-like flavin-dependent oxidoreductase (luciferase family)